MAIEAAKNATSPGASSEIDSRIALRKAWDKATVLRRLLEDADNRTREWFMDVVWLDFPEADYRRRKSSGSSDEPGENED